jgi:hypothetical protein
MNLMCPFCRVEYTHQEPCFCQPRVQDSASRVQARTEVTVADQKHVPGAALPIVLRGGPPLVSPLVLEERERAAITRA